MDQLDSVIAGPRDPRGPVRERGRHTLENSGADPIALIGVVLKQPGGG
jgi:hypothetical protein